MKTKTSTFVVTSLLSLGVALSASAQTASTTKATTRATKTQAQITKVITRADQEITRRIEALTALSNRIATSTRVTAQDKSSISNTVQTEITNLTNLKTKIDSDTDLTSLRADVKSITGSYRIFALVIPQGHLVASVDGVYSVADALTAMAAKLQTRIQNAQSKGMDVTALNAKLADLNAKVADARTQANAALAESSPLKPDNGDKALMTSNTSTLKDARAKIKAAFADLQAARQDAKTIVSTLKGENGNKEGTTTRDEKEGTSTRD